MTPRRRLILALALTAIALTAVVVFAVVRFHQADTRGAAGLSYIEASHPRQGQFLGMGPGDIMLSYPGSAAQRAGVGRGDRVVAIDGIPIAEVARLRQLDARVRSGDTVVYTLERDGVRRDVPLRFSALFRNNTTTGLYIVVHAFVGICFVIIGLVVFTRKPDDRRVIVFYAMVIVGALSIAGSMLLAIDNVGLRGIVVAPAQTLLPLAVISVFVIAFLPLTLHLALVFPHDRKVLRDHPVVIRWVYGIPLLGAILAIAISTASMILPSIGKTASSRVDSAGNIAFAVLTLAGLLLALRLARLGRTEGYRRAIVDRPGHTLTALFGILFGAARITRVLDLKIATAVIAAFTTLLPFLVLAAFPVLACIALYRSYQEAGSEERRQVKWPLWGTLIALATKVIFSVANYTAIAYLMVREKDLGDWTVLTYSLQTIPVIVYLLIPISFAFAILKYRLMNIDLIIRRTVAYAILSGAIVVLYLVLVGGLGTVLVQFAGVQNQTMVIASTLVVALLFVPLRNRLQGLVDKNLFPHRFSYPEALRAVAADARIVSDVSEFLHSVSEKLQQALQNRSVVIFTERQDDFVATAKIGLADSVLGRTRLSGTFATHLERPFDPRRRTLEPEHAEALARVETVLVVPIARRGFISLAPKLSGAVFDVEDIDFLQSVGSEVGLALERIRMQGDEADFAQARAIQERLIPREMPKIERLEICGDWQPARTMGGDYFDAIELGPAEVALCIGDVAGKGMPAALIMSGLQAAVRSSAQSSPRELCERVRRVVVSSLSGGRFVTFFYATLDVGSSRLRWCNAGHNAPILVRNDGTTVRLAGGGPAFSRLFREDPYTEHETSVSPGDRIVLFTDGLSEAAGRNPEQFSEERLEAIVREHRRETADELRRLIVESALQHSGGELDDDMTIVVAAVVE
ncbi:MAG TPA: SpoIIE family protein phosphatase [Thermoanaerobaculia bacterium]